MGARGGARVVGDDAGVAVVVQAGKRERRVNYIRNKSFAGEAVGGGNTLSFVGGKARMVKTVQDVEGGLADPAGLCDAPRRLLL